MVSHVIIKDFKRNRVVTIILILFIIMASMLAASAINIFGTLIHSVETYFEISKTPHYIQMHSGEINEKDLEKFAKEHNYIKDYQIVRLLNIDTASLFLRNENVSETGSVIDAAIVTQNKSFDYILDMNNQIAEVNSGEVALPVYYSQKYDIGIGDNIYIKTSNETITLKIVAFSRDSQMNSSFISSKRLLVSQEDYKKIGQVTGNLEYIIEYLVQDESAVSILETDYRSAGLPANGAAVSYSQIKLLNCLTDVIMAAIIILASILLILISVLCIRFAMMTSIDEDYTQIGIMKGIGIPLKTIKNLYFTKYIIVSAIGCVIGHILSKFVNRLLEENIRTYMGLSEKSNVDYFLQVIGSVLAAGLVLALCKKALRGIDYISTVDVLRNQKREEHAGDSKKFRLFNQTNLNVNKFLAVKYMLGSKKSYILMFLVFAVSIMLMLIPLNLLTTFSSPDFVTYMGVGKCDIRVDIQYRDHVEEKFKEIRNFVSTDADIAAFAYYKTYYGKTTNSEDEDVYINVEMGDVSVFPLQYLEGKEPQSDSEIVISTLASSILKKGIGDQLYLTLNGEYNWYKVTGIYQDVTNGGKSAKLLSKPDENAAMWYTINLNLIKGVEPSLKKADLEMHFPEAQFTDMEDYVAQSMSTILQQIKMIVIILSFIAIIISVLNASMFLKLILIREKKDVAIFKSLGLKTKDIKKQYLIRFFISQILGIVTGVILVNTMGEYIVGMLTSSMGISKLDFIINAGLAYIAFPLLLIFSLILSMLVGLRKINKIDITEFVADF